MFSIAAINDVEITQHDWQPLAPTKEAQEFRLTQMYHESLMHMQAGEYKQAQQLLQLIIEDPLSLNVESENTASCDPMRQLRFLSFRNLAEAFLRQGQDFGGDALQCYLHAVSIDDKDVTLWNRLGTLACSLDALNIARWAFECGLQCSPQHWVCMEKLMEVLIAIGDEAACSVVVDSLLKVSPSHSRATLIKRAIEGKLDLSEVRSATEKQDNCSIMLRGIDRLKPHHYSLSFSKKRKFDDLQDTKVSSNKHVLKLELKEVTLNELLVRILEIFDSDNVAGCIGMQETQNINTSNTQDHSLMPEVSKGIANAAIRFSIQGKDLDSVKMHTNTELTGTGSKTSGPNREEICDDMSNILHVKKMKQDVLEKSDISVEKAITLKENSPDEEPPLERRSTRLERIRTRNFDRNEEQENMQPEGVKNKVSTEELLKLFQPFIVCKYSMDKDLIPSTGHTSEEESIKDLNALEERAIMSFLRKSACNSGVYHVAQKLIEEISLGSFKPLESSVKLFQVERYVRSSSKTLNPFCSLFLAEVYLDTAIFSTEELERKTFLEECEYHLCRILEYLVTMFGTVFPAFCIRFQKNLDDSNAGENMQAGTEFLCEEFRGHEWSFWVRFNWVSARLYYFLGNCERAREDFSKCLQILQTRSEYGTSTVIVNLSHCKIDEQVSVQTVKHKLHEVQIQEILSHSAEQMLEDGQNSELIELLVPIVLMDSENKGLYFLGGKKHASDFSTELAALDILINACEKCEPRNFSVALQSYCRKVHIHLLTTGIMKAKSFPDNVAQDASQLQADSVKVDQVNVIAKEVKHVSRFLADVVQINSETPTAVVFDPKLLGRMQQLLLTVFCYLVTSQAAQKFFPMPLGSSDLSENCAATCLVDTAVAFCRLQHLHTSTTIEEQVNLLVRVHNLLAEKGLCCAGKSCEGGEGVFLKMAIRHLLLLELKLKSSILDENASTVGPMHHNSKETDKDYISRDDVADGSMEERRDEELEEDFSEKGQNKLASSSSSEQLSDLEQRKNDLGLDLALDQNFFCLYGLNLRGGFESSGSQDSLAIHINTSLGDYQTREQCAEVFHYLLPYARSCSKTCLAKLRKVLRAIRQHFPDPPEQVLENNPIDAFLDNSNLDENKVSSMILNHADVREVLEYALRGTSSNKCSGNGNVEVSNSQCAYEVNRTNGSSVSQIHYGKDTDMQSNTYLEVFKNLYYLLAQIEEGSASDKWPGFVLTKEGEEFVEQNAKLIKYDLMYNNMRFESWHKLANLFDEEVDLMLNDGSKTCSALEWHTNGNLLKRVDTGRRRTRRCLLMSMALANTPDEQRSVHELLGLVYYDTLQNVAPAFNQRQHVVIRDAKWREVCQMSLLHFEKALSFRSEWLYSYYLGKLCEKLGEPCEVVLQYYQDAVQANSSAVDPLYRLHASRLKWLCKKGRSDMKILKAVAKHCFSLENQEKVDALIDEIQSAIDSGGGESQMPCRPPESQGEKTLSCVWNILFDDGLKALETCIEGELKHFHKARYCLARCLYARNKENDVERAKEELGFCFKSNRSLFIINMWEIDGSTKKNRRTGVRRVYEITMPESSRKFITCLRKYLLFYFQLCEETLDVCTLERAYNSLRADKKFSLCLADMVNVVLGKYIHCIAAAIAQFDSIKMVPNLSLSNVLERFFNIFMDHGGSLLDVVSVSLTEAGIIAGPALSETSVHGYIHRYLHILELENKVDVLEAVNERIKKRFKTPKLVKENSARIFKHAAIAWCRCLCASLSAISAAQAQNLTTEIRNDGGVLNSEEQLVVELKVNDLFSSMSDYCMPVEHLMTTEHFRHLSCMVRVPIGQATPENREKASCLLKQAFVFYRDCTGPFPAGINLYMLKPGSGEELVPPVLPGGSLTGVDLSLPRKLLLWAYTLVHGSVCSIAEAVRFCEDQAKIKARKGVSQISPPVSCQG
ncbi:hypothetical protein KP509_11G076900 [Ceratopteris richardii]|uniref:Uncharacterized protein n=1 Tax=Ceratopteris richardii TaxID=49495 RepID=A0A8T2TZN4_CERRI|nr:hypothetical protein KP509_11G076900 [Ceratopteris richardii]